MKKSFTYIAVIASALFFVHACGEAEQPQPEVDQQAVQDSLERVYEKQMEEMRQDSIEQARADSIAKAEAEPDIRFTEDGSFTVQVEAWRSYTKAENQISTWKDRGYENAYVVQYGDADKGDLWYRVRLGTVENMEMARKLREKLKSEYDAESWISAADKDRDKDDMQAD